MVFVYPTEEQIIETNKEILIKIKVKKADSHKVLSIGCVRKAVQCMTEDKGDLLDKAVTVLIFLCQNHCFDSGNRRTAFVIAKAFLKANNLNPQIVYDENVLMGARQGFYSKIQIKEWLSGNAIPEYRR